MAEPTERLFRGFHERDAERSEVDFAREDLAAALRELHDIVVSGAADITHLRSASERVRSASTLLNENIAVETYQWNAESGDIAGATSKRTSFVDRSPLSGGMNPLAPPMTMVVQHPDEQRGIEGQVAGTVTFGLAYEGPPGCVHGGFVAAAFDEVLGQTQALTGEPGMTAELTVRYKAPTPLNVELVFTGRVVRVEGRKIFTHATLMAGGRLCAESDGLFISMNKEVFARLLKIRTGERSEDPE